jgi:hypothetical protein
MDCELSKTALAQCRVADSSTPAASYKRCDLIHERREPDQSTLRPPTRLPLQVSCPEQKTQKLPLLLPHKSEYIPSSQRFGGLARIGFHAPAQKFAAPRRQSMSPRRIPKKSHRSKHVPAPPSECKSLRHDSRELVRRAAVTILRYSLRNACIGSIRDAFHAGIMQASAATASSIVATAVKIAGSSD